MQTEYNLKTATSTEVLVIHLESTCNASLEGSKRLDKYYPIQEHDKLKQPIRRIFTMFMVIEAQSDKVFYHTAITRTKYTTLSTVGILRKYTFKYRKTNIQQ